MKAYLKFEFDLPEENPEFMCRVNAGNYQSGLWDISQWLRSQDKYYSEIWCKKDGSEALDEIRDKFYEFLNDYNVELE